VLRQNVVLSPTPIIPVELVQQSLGSTPGRLPCFDEARDEFTRSYLSSILQITGGNVSQAARLARRNRTDFYRLLARHQLTPEEFKQRWSARCAPVWVVRRARPVVTETALQMP
jgi:two-component system, NtrC family, response regulator GlrR